METIAIIVVLAVLVEAIIEYLGTPIPSAYKPYVAAALGIVVCVGFQADLLAILFRVVGSADLPAARIPFLGEVLTGLLIGRGSNYINDLVSRLGLVRLPVAPLRAVQEAIDDRAEPKL